MASSVALILTRNPDRAKMPERMAERFTSHLLLHSPVG